MYIRTELMEREQQNKPPNHLAINQPQVSPIHTLTQYNIPWVEVQSVRCPECDLIAVLLRMFWLLLFFFFT